MTSGQLPAVLLLTMCAPARAARARGLSAWATCTRVVAFGPLAATTAVVT
jgi:hypothetical protein